MELETELREFLIECNEYMEVLDRDILLLEESPHDAELISSVFRAVHTIKGTCGFFGFDQLGAVTHVAETILDQVRERERSLTPQLVSLILEALDAARVLLKNIENNGTEGHDSTGPLRERLEEAALACQGSGNPQSLVQEEDVAAASNHRRGASETTDSQTMDSASPTGSAVPSPAPAATSLAKEPEQPVVPSVPIAVVPVVVPKTVELFAAEQESGKALVQENTRELSKDAQLTESTIRVDVALLNRLMNLVGELVLARNQLLQDATTQNTSVQQTSQRLNLITSELQEGVMKTRMQPIGVVWNKLPRVVRDLAAQCGKAVRIEMQGADTELDKTIIEAIKDPLTHIVRNSCDHGIETPEVRNAKGKNPEGLLLLRAYHEGGVVNIEISDDGAGIDPDRVKKKAVEKGLIRPEQAGAMSDRDAAHLIFLPGFSTAAQISTVSGRGVGMDVVKTNIEKIGGSVYLQNRADAGTTIRIKIPLTLAIIPGLVVGLQRPHREDLIQPQRSQQDRFIIPQANLLELVRIEALEIRKRVENVHGTPVFRHRGKLLPLIYLAEVLGIEREVMDEESINIVVIQADSKQLGLVVDSIRDTQEIVVKPLGRQLKGLICYVGATIMGDGRPALILDVAGLARLARLGTQNRPAAHGVDSPIRTAFTAEPKMFLLFRAGPYERMAVPLALVDRLEEVKASEVEYSGGAPVLHYRGEILPLRFLGSANAELQSNANAEAMLQIVVFTNDQQRMGLVVDKILDIVSEVITVRRPTSTSTSDVLGSAVIGGKVTDLLDLSSLMGAAGDRGFTVASASAPDNSNVLLIDSSPFSREILGEQLAMRGYNVVSANDTNEILLRVREQSGFAVILFKANAGDEYKQELADAICLDETLARVPIVELVEELRESASGETARKQLLWSNITGLMKTLIGLKEAGAGKVAR